MLGTFCAPVKMNGVTEEMPIAVTKGDKAALLGRNWLERRRLDWSKIFSISETDMVSRLKPYQDVFGQDLGIIKTAKARLELKPGATPKFSRPRSVPYALHEKVRLELNRLEELGILKKVQSSSWAAPIVVVDKPNGKIRICGDYKVALNSNLVVDQYPLPRPEDMFATLEGGVLYTKMDLSQAYFQLELEESSQELVTITTIQGLYRYTRLPFGVASAPAKFQQVMEDILRDIPGVKVYLDDILVTGKSPEEHWSRVEEVLRRLQAAGVRLQKEKCLFGVPELEFLGHVVGAEGIKTSPQKVAAILETKEPENVTELRSFLGLITYYGKFIPALSRIAYPLNQLLQKDQKWKWDQPEKDAWGQLKRLMASSRVLCHYSPERQLRLACDASAFGIAAVLSHIFADGTERPIAYASRSLLPAEKNYARIDKEALSIIFGVKRFHSYLYGRKFTLITDHKPLLAILGPKSEIPTLAAARMQRWALILSAYHYEIQFRPTGEHGNADALSRLPLPLKQGNRREEEDSACCYSMEFFKSAITFEIIREETKKDRLLQQVVGRLKDGWREDDFVSELATFAKKKLELTLEKGVVLWGRRVVVPETLRVVVLNLLHEEHSGVSRMKSVARSYVWWPLIDSQLEGVTRNCSDCLQTRKMPAQLKNAEWPMPSTPWHRIHLDFAGPFEDKMLMVLVDASTKWVEVVILNTTTAEKTIEELRRIFATHGLPVELVTDNGPQFTSAVFSAFMKENGIRHLMGAPYHPQTNGLAERMVQTVKKSLTKQRSTEKSLIIRLARFLFSYRSTPHPATGKSPAESLMGRKFRSKFDLLLPPTEEKADVDDFVAKFHVGQPVMAKDFRPGQNWKPGTIAKRIGLFLYLIQMEDGQLWKRHVDQLIAGRGGCAQPATHGPITPPRSTEPEVTLPTTPDEPQQLTPESTTSTSPVTGVEPNVDPAAEEGSSSSTPTQSPNTPARRPKRSAGLHPKYQDYSMEFLFH